MEMSFTADGRHKHTRYTLELALRVVEDHPGERVGLSSDQHHDRDV